MDTITARNVACDFDGILSPFKWRISVAESLAINLPLSLIYNRINTSGNPLGIILLYIFTMMILHTLSRYSTGHDIFSKPEPVRNPSERKEDQGRQQAGSYDGLFRYIDDSLGEYLTPIQIRRLHECIIRIRERKKGEKIEECIRAEITGADQLRSTSIETKVLKKCNLYAFIHNMTGYLHITRREAGIILKLLFPSVFASTSATSIDKSLTAEKDMKKLEIEYLESNTENSFTEFINRIKY